MKGYKMTRPDGTDFYSGKLKYSVGATINVDGTDNGNPCGSGIHVAKERHGPLIYNAYYPLRLFEVSYDKDDVLGEDDDKVRVSSCIVEKELDPYDIGLPNADRFKNIMERCHKIRLRARASLWVSVRDAVRESVWNSVRDKVWGSVWDSIWAFVADKHVDITMPLFEIVEHGATLYGIDDNGIAHIIMPSEDEVEERGE